MKTAFNNPSRTPIKTSVSCLALSAPMSLLAGVAMADQSDAAWDYLAQVEVEEFITETSYEVRKTFPANLEDGIEDFDITGYVVPLTDGPTVTDFILISDAGFCPFCGSPEHGVSLQVSMASPSPDLVEGARVRLRGLLEAVVDPETFQATKMRDAHIIDG